MNIFLPVLFLLQESSPNPETSGPDQPPVPLSSPEWLHPEPNRVHAIRHVQEWRHAIGQQHLAQLSPWDTANLCGEDPLCPAQYIWQVQTPVKQPVQLFRLVPLRSDPICFVNLYKMQDCLIFSPNGWTFFRCASPPTCFSAWGRGEEGRFGGNWRTFPFYLFCKDCKGLNVRSSLHGAANFTH